MQAAARGVPPPSGGARRGHTARAAAPGWRQRPPACPGTGSTPGAVIAGSSRRRRSQPAPRGRQPLALAAAAPAGADYSAEAAADEWARRPVPVVARLLEIGVAFAGWWARAALHRDARRAAAEMREVLVALGPAFIKIGQALASRPDVLPPEYIAELELLQDRIPAFDPDEALQVIEAELGRPWRDVFSELTREPVAAASLGQVHRGRLAATGEEVAVKVQRPGVVEAIGRDTYIMRQLAGLARARLRLNTDLPALVDEWAASLFKELDYRLEAANAVRFADLYSFMPEVLVPGMHTSLTTSRVLVMQWLDGERLRSAAVNAQPGEQQPRQRLSPEQVAQDLRLVEIGVRCSLEQILEEGYYHADPHAGNIMRAADGRLIYLGRGCLHAQQSGGWL